MKAVDFIRKFGWGKAKGIVALIQDGVVSYTGTSVNYDDLKTLVDAYELMQTGLQELKDKMFSNSKTIDDVKQWVLATNESLLTHKGFELKQAITLVEEVGECDE